MIYPQIDPIAVQIGPLAVHWYGLMYLIGIFGGWALLVWRARRDDVAWRSNQIGDLIFYCAIGIVVGGRLGYVAFYNLPFYFAHPLNIFYVWDGGMSFHGGLIGVLVACGLYAWRHRRHFFDIMDFIAPVVPIGLAAGRLGNFINGELWGKVAQVPWAMRLPCADPRFTARYCNGVPTGFSPPHQPSQLYELLLEGVALFIICWWFSMKPRPRMAISGVFALGYGVFRFFVEFFRLPDPQLGYLAFGWLTMGQVLSLPLILIGIVLLLLAYRRRAYAPTQNPESADKAMKA
ncbi:MAG: prolipoprotein diacylglyceryl transferase [Gammaproteobacteria bacterium]|nr:prolipoprotein diacylglyceryl transferase [Gammaproteobacteria bacterium]